MTEENIKFLSWFVPVVAGAVTIAIKWINKFYDYREKKATTLARESSVGETAVKELAQRLEEAKGQRERMHEEIEEMKKVIYEMKEEFRYFKEEIRKHGLETVERYIEQLERLNKNK